jgi:hypothetical protein
MIRSVTILLALIGSLTVLPSFGQTPTLKLRQSMTAEEFRAAGLDKLSKAEFDALEKWFNRHTVKVFRLAKGGASGSSSADGSAFGACATAKLVNQRTGDVCEVWCE